MKSHSPPSPSAGCNGKLGYTPVPEGQGKQTPRLKGCNIQTRTSKQEAHQHASANPALPNLRPRRPIHTASLERRGCQCRVAIRYLHNTILVSLIIRNLRLQPTWSLNQFYCLYKLSLMNLTTELIRRCQLEIITFRHPVYLSTAIAMEFPAG